MSAGRRGSELSRCSRSEQGGQQGEGSLPEALKVSRAEIR
jgi:hypothetical protein